MKFSEKLTQGGDKKIPKNFWWILCNTFKNVE